MTTNDAREELQAFTPGTDAYVLYQLVMSVPRSWTRPEFKPIAVDAGIWDRDAPHRADKNQEMGKQIVNASKPQIAHYMAHYLATVAGARRRPHANELLSLEARKVLADKMNDAGRTSRRRGAPHVTADSDRATLIRWLQWNDPNGRYSDEDAKRDDMDPLTVETAWDLIADQLSDYEIEAKDFDSKDAAVASARKQGRGDDDVYHEKGRWHVAREVAAEHLDVVVASFKSHPHASKHCSEASAEVKTLSKHVHWKQDHGIFLGKGQLSPMEYLVEPMIVEPQYRQTSQPFEWVLYLIRHKSRGRRELVYLSHSHSVARVMGKADKHQEMAAAHGERDEITQEKSGAREPVTVAAECGCPHGGAEVEKLAPGYYAIAPDGSVMSGPHDTYGPAKQSASRLNGYVRFAAEHAAGEKNGGRGGGYCIPYIRMVRDADAYEECIATWNKGGRRIAGARDVYEALHAKLAKEDQEVFLVVLADVRGQCIGVDEVARGARDRVDVDIARVFASVAVYRPHHYIVVHNHPSRKANPSQADKDLTKTIEEASRPFSRSSAFVDHVVVGMGEYYSFADGKLHHVKLS
jgi:hypothetical protein